MMDEAYIEKLRRAGWSDKANLGDDSPASVFNFRGRIEAASGLPPDEIPEHASFAEARGG